MTWALAAMRSAKEFRDGFKCASMCISSNVQFAWSSCVRRQPQQCGLCIMQETAEQKEVQRRSRKGESVQGAPVQWRDRRR